MGIKLSKAPVCLTVAQVRFNAILVLDRYLPDIQDGFRQAGFPVYNKSITQVIEFVALADGQAQAKQDTKIRYVFGNASGTGVMLLDQNALTYELSDYPVFEDFAAQMLTAMSVLKQFLPLELTDRLGMRMVDAIQPLGADRLEDYLVPEAFGFSNRVQLGLDHQQTLAESTFLSGTRGVTFRAARVPHGVALPPDLSTVRTKINDRFLKYQGETIMLDCDSYEAGQQPFNLDALTASLSDLKSSLSTCFKSVVTDHALAAWR